MRIHTPRYNLHAKGDESEFCFAGLAAQVEASAATVRARRASQESVYLNAVR